MVLIFKKTIHCKQNTINKIDSTYTLLSKLNYIMIQGVAVLGSTGSIGEQTLNVVRNYPEHFRIESLTSNNRWERLVEQAIEMQPDSVVIANKELYPLVKEALKDEPIKVYAGEESLAQIVSGDSIDVVVNSLVGYAGLAPTIATLEAKKKLALANKESLVVAGDLVMKLSAQNNTPIIPIDSEHSAIFQCLVGERSPIHKVLLTASGGPFRNTPIDQFEDITVEQALNHPNWVMGAKITIDSATMLNKGFEAIEAKWLFDVTAEQIEIVVHPQSVIHSMVEFEDGAIKAQLGVPDMHLPIQYALTFPFRMPLHQPRFSFRDYPELTFTEPNLDCFPALRIALESLQKGGSSCCTLNAANEVAVQAFLEKKIGFTDISKVLEYALLHSDWSAKSTQSEYAICDAQAREIANKYIK